MKSPQKLVQRGWKAVAILVTGSLMQFSFEGCNDMLTNLTRYVDPCATFLANCAPGSFETNAADIGDYCVDPACTVPGGCGQLGPPLGTITQVCP